MLQDDGEIRKSAAIDNQQIASRKAPPREALIIDKKQMPEISSQMLDSPEIAANQTNQGKFNN